MPRQHAWCRSGEALSIIFVKLKLDSTAFPELLPGASEVTRELLATPKSNDLTAMFFGRAVSVVSPVGAPVPVKVKKVSNMDGPPDRGMWGFAGPGGARASRRPGPAQVRGRTPRRCGAHPGVDRTRRA